MSRRNDLAKAALCGLYKYSGVVRVQEALRRQAGQPFMVILVFHRVTDAIPEDGITVSTRRFRAICGLLRSAFRVVPLGEVFRALRAGGPMPPRTVAVTFDDSYRDNLEAARVLAEQGLPATFFLPTAFVDSNHTFPWDRHLPRLPNLSWADVRAMAALGHEIGSHTVTHPDLGAVSHERAWDELVGSKAALEEQLCRPVRWFAYPFGGKDNLRPEWVPLIAEAGYEGGLSAHNGFVYPDSDPRVLPREAALDEFHSLLHLELHLTGCLQWYYALKRRLGRDGDTFGPRFRHPEIGPLPAAEACVGVHPHGL
jgi:peptidoglycan/xylan/chitin deacetylase (PgdA/CDA1 family)